MKDGLTPISDSAPESTGDRDDLACAITTELRILATTDVHMQFLGHDYVQDTCVGHQGLAGLASLITAARAEAAASGTPSLLFDNGDILQGSALGDAMATLPVTPKHPIVASLNAMKYDAIGIGNHDLDYGITYLQRIAGLTNAPWISTNLHLKTQCAIQQWAIVECEYADATMEEPPALQIGLVSLLPAQTGIWNKPMLEGHAEVRCPHKSLIDAVQQLRQAGADIIILLAHMGIEDSGTTDDVRAMANVPGVDAMITGHTHRRLPGKDHAGFQDVDINKGALGPCPAAMPGFNASDLAILDLKLSRTGDDKWHVVDHDIKLQANSAEIAADPQITRLCAPAHEATRTKLAEPVGQVAYPLHNFFSLAMPTPTCALIAAAQSKVVANGLRGAPEAELPLLVTAAADTAGGRGGPDHFLNIPPGTIYRRALAGLNPYGNAICALRITGAELRAWLEHTVGIYARLSPGSNNQPLLRSDRPTFHFDTIYGVRYGVDPTRPDGQRVTGIEYKGALVGDAQSFILATTKFRAAGGGGGPQFGPEKIVFYSNATVSDALLDTLKSERLGKVLDHRPWSFDCEQPVQAVLQTSHDAMEYLDKLAHLSPEPLPIDGQGFMPIRLTL